MAEEVHNHVAKRMRQLMTSTYSGAMTEENFTSEEEEEEEEEEQYPGSRWRKQLKSGIHHWTRATTVVRKLTWPHDIVYTTARKLAACQDISLPLFLQGYMIIMEGEEGAMKEKMASYL